jgi:hypothetical protein
VGPPWQSAAVGLQELIILRLFAPLFRECKAGKESLLFVEQAACGRGIEEPLEIGVVF